MGLVVTVRSLLESAIEWGFVDRARTRDLLDKLAREMAR
jgi:hypothetical protein